MNKENSPINEEKNKDFAEPKMLDEQWLSLTKDWQEQPFKKTDLNALIKQTRRRTLWAKGCFVLNILATLGLTMAFFYGLFTDVFEGPVLIYFGIGSLLSIIFVYFEIKIRMFTWHQLCDSPDKAINNALVACQSSINYMVLLKVSFIPFSLLVNWFVYTLGETRDIEVFVDFIVINSLMVITYLIVEYLHRKRKQQYQRLKLLFPE